MTQNLTMTMLGVIAGLPTIRLIDIFDILLVALLVYYVYRMAKGTNVMLIFWALLIMLIAWRIADALGMRLLHSECFTACSVMMCMPAATAFP